ncbi:MAG TPA: glycoside hydrolase family 31 protein [Clostridiaceae bacterium]
MDSLFRNYEDKLLWECRNEILSLEPWGKNGIRVRATYMNEFGKENWALLPKKDSKFKILIEEDKATLENGKIKAEVLLNGNITFYNQKNEIILKEYVRNRVDISQYCSALGIASRDLRPILSGDYSLTLRFESEEEEKIYGMGQYQQAFLNLKGCTLELAQRNSQVSVPFALSSLGYGFLWNNPAIGDVTFGLNRTEWNAKSTKEMDYWITAGDTPSEIEESYAAVTGTVPMMPEYGIGFWQCKLRYQTQDELLTVAREYKKRNIPLAGIVIDFFHWTNHGDWKFDLDYWPDPEGMVKELNEMGTQLMVSVWPTVAKDSENYEEMNTKGYLIRSDKGKNTNMEFLGNCVFFDATNPGARKFIWEKVKKNYYDKGIKMFWLDEAEPEYGDYDHELYRQYIGPSLQTGNIYPSMFSKAFYDGMTQEGQENVVNLVRCAWAGSQRYGALVWSGDIHSSFRSLREQFGSGLNMGLAGIPWWTTDIGGFLGGYPDDEDFRECLIRWFQYGAFCPVFRLHGERMPHKAPIGTSGGGKFFSGAANEIWSYGEDAYEIFKKYILLREKMRPYIRTLMEAAHEKGTPIIRPLFYDFPEDKSSWEIKDQYMFGGDVLVAPILHEKERSRKVYLPSGHSWKDYNTNITYEGGKFIDCAAPLDIIPFFIKDEKSPF